LCFGRETEGYRLAAGRNKLLINNAPTFAFTTVERILPLLGWAPGELCAFFHLLEFLYLYIYNEKMLNSLAITKHNA
jgi:hypothetical protein